MNQTPLRDEIRALVLDTLLLSIPPSELTDERPLFGPGGPGLDSVDALQLVVALDKQYGLKVSDVEVARKTLATVASIAQAVEDHRTASAQSGTGTTMTPAAPSA